MARAKPFEIRPDLEPVPYADGNDIGFSFLGGKVLLGDNTANMNQMQRNCILWAVTGISRDDIVRRVYATIGTVGNTLTQTYKDIDLFDRDDPQAALLAKCLGADILTIGEPGNARLFDATQSELEVIARAAHGLGNTAIGHELGIAAVAVGSRLERLADRIGFSGRVPSILAAFITGQVVLDPASGQPVISN
jgi:DNA-binding CsgD family transcriptional regulator